MTATRQWGYVLPSEVPPWCLTDGDVACEGSIPWQDGKICDSFVSSWPGWVLSPGSRLGCLSAAEARCLSSWTVFPATACCFFSMSRSSVGCASLWTWWTLQSNILLWLPGSNHHSAFAKPHTKPSTFSPSGELEPGSELGLCHRVPRGQHRGRGLEGGEALPGSGTFVASHQDRAVCRHRTQQKRRYEQSFKCC